MPEVSDIDRQSIRDSTFMGYPRRRGIHSHISILLQGGLQKNPNTGIRFPLTVLDGLRTIFTCAVIVKKVSIQIHVVAYGITPLP